MSRISVSIGVLPTKRTKKSCSITCKDWNFLVRVNLKYSFEELNFEMNFLFLPVTTRFSAMASVGAACRIASVDLDIAYDNTLRVHIAISLAETQCARHRRDHMHLWEEENINNKFALFCGRLRV